MEWIVGTRGAIDTSGHIGWYNLWRIRRGPYGELLEDDTVYWYDSVSKRIIGRSLVREVERFSYSRKNEVASRLRLNREDRADPYYVGGPPRGYCLAFEAGRSRPLSVERPGGIRFPRHGWLRVDDEVARRWLKKAPSEEVTLDDLTSSKGSLLERLMVLSKRISGLSVERVRRIVSQTIRRDTVLIKGLKKLCNHRCQFPRCGARIRKRDGGLYVEVAHIEPVRGGGESVLGNLVVVCPNHHKEFDYGTRRIIRRTATSVVGVLNGKKFEIRLPQG